MTRVIVRDMTNTQVAVVRWDNGGDPEVITSDATVRAKLERALERGRKQGLAHRSYRRAKTPHGVKYQTLGRWVKPAQVGFPQALADYLVNEELIAYTEEDD